MKVITIIGTRPELIRLSQIIKKLDRFAERHILVHTGQNYDPTLSNVFFEQLQIRKPDYHLHLRSHTFGAQTGQMFEEIESILTREKPDKMLVLGDTNSALCAVLGARMGIPVYHMEAGNRCYDIQVPEEVNRRLIDSISTFNLPYTPGSRENLIREGVLPNRIWVSGNPIYEVLQIYEDQIQQSTIIQKFKLMENKYFLVTVHRAENVDVETRLRSIFSGLNMIATKYEYPVLISLHPRTQDRLKRYQIQGMNSRLIFFEPLGLWDFVRLQRGASCVITDSGTVQEESCILRVPSVTIRQSTERPETIICGSNVLSGVNAPDILDCVDLMVQAPRTWDFPVGYEEPNVATKIVQFLIGGLSYV